MPLLASSGGDRLRSLGPALYGYLHQDAVTAFALAALLLPRTDDRTVVADRKAFAEDLFDDLQVGGEVIRRNQIKFHAKGTKQLAIADFTSDRINFRIDKAIRSFLADPSPADEYRLQTTFGHPENSLNQYLQPAPDRAPLLHVAGTRRYSLDAESIWPTGGEPVWKALKGIGRDEFLRFSDCFVIETGCPASSGDLRDPGPLEAALLSFLHERIGIGRPPNDHRDLADAAAHLIQFAAASRAKGAGRTADEVISALALKVDFGRVEEHFPLDETRLVPLDDEVNAVASVLQSTSRLAVTGPPGAGKSWFLNLLAKRLSSDGWIVATHFCFTDLLDDVRERRATVEAMLGSLIAELLERDPSLATDRVARFAAGPLELEKLLAVAQEERPNLRIAIIVDGVDHADRALAPGRPGAAAEIAQELAALELPPGMSLIVGSQPGDHLSAFLSVAEQHSLSPWASVDIRALADSAGVSAALSGAGLGLETDRVIDVIIDKSNGNPLYATYLSRAATSLATGEVVPRDDLDVAGQLASAPRFDSDLGSYYTWLLQGIRNDTGAMFMAQMLSLLDFAVTADEMREMYPAFAHHVPTVLGLLAPVLAEDTSLGGVRVYHESFQRFVREGLVMDPVADLASILSPAIDWLRARGFFEDRRAFRSLFGLLRAADRDREVVDLVGIDFVPQAIAQGQPGDAVMANLSVAGGAAADLRSWRDLARLIEISRAADLFYNWRLDVEESLAEAYGRSFAAIFGASALAERLLHDGRCTFRARPGLFLCQLCDEHGAIPPWSEYLTAYDHFRRTDNSTNNDRDGRMAFARARGQFRLSGYGQAIDETLRALASPEDLDLHPHDIVYVLGEMYGMDAVEAVVSRLPSGIGRAWAHFAIASLADDQQLARDHANAAVEDGLPRVHAGSLLRLGADPSRFSPPGAQLDQLSGEVCTREVRLQDDLLARWIADLDISAAQGDEAALFRTELLIPADSWYHRWLRFAVTLRRNVDNDFVLNELSSLAENIEVFKGDPRVCDLFPVHADIRRSFHSALGRFDDAQWCNAVEALAAISSETSTWLQGSRSGPLPLDDFLQLCLETADSAVKELKAAEVAGKLLAPERRPGEFYDTHAEDQLLLSRLQVAAGDVQLARDTWKEACVYLAAYGWRKDITVYELIDPLDSLAEVDRARAGALLRDVQPVVEGVLVHTDGKETRHAIHKWVDMAARIHPAGALMYLAREGLNRHPYFGGLFHAMPIALEVLTGSVPPSFLAAAWLAAGEEARQSPEAALRACELNAALNPLSNSPWSVVLGALVGDGVGPVVGTAKAAEESAQRIGLHPCPIVDKQDDGGQKPDQYRSSRHEAPLVDKSVFWLSHDATPLQIAYAVRRWRDSRDQASVDAVVNAVGWRIIVLEQDGRMAEAEQLIRRMARDTSPWEVDGILSGIAEGMRRHGSTRLAALAATFAYTRARDGWRRFAGQKSQDFFLTALDLDPDLAWATLADEVADGISRGGEYGINAHLIELLTAGGLVAEAFDSWGEACRVVVSRLPPTGPVDDIDIEYDHEQTDVLSSLACAAAARLNHALIDERRVAMAGVALLVSLGGPSFGAAIRLVAEQGPPSALVTLLHIVLSYEPEPFEATVVAQDSLRDVAQGELVSARMLARKILQRAGIDITTAPPAALSVAPSLDEDRVEVVIGGIGRARIGPVQKVWPEFGRLAAERVELAMNSPELRDRMESAYDRLRLQRKGRKHMLWMPIDEEIERVLQQTGAAVRSALATEGVIDPEVEDSVGRLLLADLDLGIRLALSRTARPDHRVRPTQAIPGTEPGYQLVSGGDFGGWVVLAHHETELVVGEKYDKPIEARPEVWSALEFAEGELDLKGQLPVGYGRPGVWLEPAPASVAPGPFLGPLAGFDIRRDPFGAIETMAPHPILVIASGLSPGPLEYGLSLVDANSAPAVVCRAWRQNLLGDNDLDDHEHRLVGIELLARPDIVEAAATWAVGDPVHVVVTSITESTGSSE